MNPAQITAKIWYGYGKAGQKLGLPHTVYRPTGAGSPLSNTPIATLPAIFSQDMAFLRFNKYGNPMWFAFVDGRTAKKWDYLVGPTQTWFIAEEQPDLPIMAILCNHTLNIVRPAQIQNTGLNTNYAGNTQDRETPVMTGYPAAVLEGSRGENSLDLPGDVRAPWWKCFLPAAPGVIIDSRDILYDENGVRYVISSAELSEFGWRLTAFQAVP